MSGVYRRAWRLPPRRRFVQGPTAIGPAAPVNTVAPTIFGTLQVGFALTSTDGTWTGDPTIVFTYQWQRDVAGNLVFGNIASAVNSTYTLVNADATCNLQIVVTGTNGVGNSSANSNTLGIIQPLPVNVSYGESDTTGQIGAGFGSGIESVVSWQNLLSEMRLDETTEGKPLTRRRMHPSLF